MKIVNLLFITVVTVNLIFLKISGKISMEWYIKTLLVISGITHQDCYLEVQVTIGSDLKKVLFQ